MSGEQPLPRVRPARLDVYDKPVSARGLFRAMGKAGRPALFDGDAGIEVAESGLPRERDDFYPTPPEPVRAFLAAEQAFVGAALSGCSLPLACETAPSSRALAAGLVWEPACGDGAMMRELAAAGFDATGSDLVDRGASQDGHRFARRDFFDFTAADRLSDVIITNPPFGLCTGRTSPFVSHALDVIGARYLALLLPAGWWGAAERKALWQRRTPLIIYGMRWRIDFTGQGAPPMLNAWHVWDRLRPPVAAGVTRFACLDRSDDARQAALGFGDTGDGA